MVVMTESWNEQRLDDLSGRLDSGFTQLRAETNDGFAQLRTEMKAGEAALRGEMNEGFAHLRTEIAELRGETHGLQRTLLQVGGGLIGTVIASTTAIVLAVT